MCKNGAKLTETDAARMVARGCRRPKQRLGSIQHLEPFSSMLGKLRRNCHYTISDTQSKNFKKGSD